MDEKLKYRLVGATVILAILAFFLPLILDSEKYHTKIESQIPEMPNTSAISSSSAEDDGKPNSNKQKATEQATNQGTLHIDLDKGAEQVKQAQVKPKSPKSEELTDKSLKASSVKPSQSTIKNDALVSKQPTPLAQSKKQKTVNKSTVAVKQAVNDSATKIAEKKSVETKKVTKAIESKPQPKKIKPVTASTEVVKKQPKANDLKFKEVAYVIQIGTFSNKANASKLVETLRSQDYRAYQRLDPSFSRVYVGPYPEKNIAEQRSKKLASVVGNSVKVIEFDPKTH